LTPNLTLVQWWVLVLALDSRRWPGLEVVPTRKLPQELWRVRVMALDVSSLCSTALVLPPPTSVPRRRWGEAPFTSRRWGEAPFTSRRCPVLEVEPPTTLTLWLVLALDLDEDTRWMALWVLPTRDCVPSSMWGVVPAAGRRPSRDVIRHQRGTADWGLHRVCGCLQVV
jgi:hypothetical protein